MLLNTGTYRVHYDLIGPETGEVVCLLHSLGSDGGMWAEQVPALLAAGYRVLRVDMRGHGGSDPVPDPCTMADLAADVAAVLDALSIGRVHLVGLSIGGMIAQALALAHGQRLHTLVLCDTSPQTAAGADAAWQPRIEAVRAQGSVAPLADATLARWLTDRFRQRQPERWTALRNTVAATSPEGYLGAAAALLDFDFVPQLPSLGMPVLVICGSDDASTPPAGNRQIAELIPGARYEVLPGARHLPNVECPEIFNALLLGWLAYQSCT